MTFAKSIAELHHYRQHFSTLLKNRIRIRYGGRVSVMNRPMREEQRPPDEAVVELAPNVRRLQLPMSMPGLGHVNCYILDDENGAALVDPGLPGPANWKALMAGLAKAEVPPERVHSIVITHSHPDHLEPLVTFTRNTVLRSSRTKILNV